MTVAVIQLLKHLPQDYSCMALRNCQPQAVCFWL